MFGRKRRDLERRIEELEQRLDPRLWELPPANTIPIEDLPTFPDYSTHNAWWDEDEEGWTRPSTHGYL